MCMRMHTSTRTSQESFYRKDDNAKHNRIHFFIAKAHRTELLAGADPIGAALPLRHNDSGKDDGIVIPECGHCIYLRNSSRWG